MLSALVMSVAFFGQAPLASDASPSVLTWAEQPGASPNYIFPITPCQYASANNTLQFQQLMYRPLYWYGLGRSTALIPSLSLALPPVFSPGDRILNITMKGWRFADGQVVNAQSAIFFLNLYRANPSAYCDYTPGLSLPDLIANVSAHGNVLRVALRHGVNPSWLIGNLLSEIVPLPDSWDRTSASSVGSCAHGAYGAPRTITACQAVANFLSQQSLMTSTFANAMWQSGVDGPWRLISLNAQGTALFRANGAYSGTPRPQFSMLKEIAYDNLGQEVADLSSGRLSVGYLSPSLMGTSGTSGLSSRYRLTPLPAWGFGLLALNLTGTGPGSALVGQLYVRQALSQAIDQSAIVSSVYHGYASASWSPLPPSTSALAGSPGPNPYPYDPARARAIFSSHGWQVENGVQTCVNPGTGPAQCGQGVSSGASLTLSLAVANGSVTEADLVRQDVADWRAVGVSVTPLTTTFSNALAACAGASTADICLWDGGWSYGADYYPSGENLLMPGAYANFSHYRDPRMTQLIRTSLFSPGSLSAYARYAAAQLPVLYQPQAQTIWALSSSLSNPAGPGPSALGTMTPEFLRPR